MVFGVVVGAVLAAGVAAVGVALLSLAGKVIAAVLDGIAVVIGSGSTPVLPASGSVAFAGSVALGGFMAFAGFIVLVVFGAVISASFFIAVLGGSFVVASGGCRPVVVVMNVARSGGRRPWAPWETPSGRPADRVYPSIAYGSA
jgi:hypothetical protein